MENKKRGLIARIRAYYSDKGDEEINLEKAIARFKILKRIAKGLCGALTWADFRKGSPTRNPAMIEKIEQRRMRRLPWFAELRFRRDESKENWDRDHHPLDIPSQHIQQAGRRP